MKEQDKSAGRGQAYNPQPEQNVKVKGPKTSRDLPDEELERGNVIESQSEREGIDTLENVDNDIERGDQAVRPRDTKQQTPSRGEQKGAEQNPAVDQPRNKGR